MASINDRYEKMKIIVFFSIVILTLSDIANGQTCIPNSATDQYFTNDNSLFTNCNAAPPPTNYPAYSDPSWPFTFINATQAWQQMLFCPSNETIIVAVIDSGITSDFGDTEHPDLPNSIFVEGRNFYNSSQNGDV